MRSIFSRRDFLAAGATIAGGLAVGSTGCSSEPTSPLPLSPDSGPAATALADRDLQDPPTIRSAGGVLAATIQIATDPALIAGSVRLAPVTYDNTYPGPTLAVRAGDMVDLTFRNRIMLGESSAKPGYGRPPRPDDTVTNVHYHGLHVTPVGSGDNMTVMTDAGRTHRYRFQIPATHPAGLFWYHAHVHGLVTNQVGRGASGMLYVGNAHTTAVDARYRRRILVLQQLYLEPDLRTISSDDGERADPDRALTLVNGKQMPPLRLQPGERQVWAMSNASTSAFYLLRFPEGVQVRVLAYDGLTRAGYAGGAGPLVHLAPGKRVELEVRAPATPMTAVLTLEPYFQGVDSWPGKPLATLVVAGNAVATDLGPVPLDPAGLPDLSGLTVARERTIILDQDDSVPEGEFGRFRLYTTDNAPHPWNPDVPEWSDSMLGTAEEWTLLNETDQEHPFHVHVNPMQVLRVTGACNGGPPPEVLTTGYHDTVVVPPHGSAVVRTQFTEFNGGPILMHCHILDHEDMGMMSWFYIQDA
jgi:FtsP/CotA-like multicopper oxidase with cupredoxin domain